MNIYSSSILILLAFCQTAYGAGGSLVGNGAGMAEHEMIYAYERLPDTLQVCVETQACGFDSAEIAIAENVRQVLRKAPNAGNKLVFLSERELPRFFDTDGDELHRIAKTDDKEYSLIFINRDALYDAAGRSKINFAYASAILFHELGHQAGEKSHIILDRIGGKIRYYLELQRTKIEHPDYNLVVNVYSAATPYSYFELFLQTSRNTVSMTSKILKTIQCLPGESLLGTQILNGAWKVSDLTAKSLEPVIFNASIRFACIAESGNITMRRGSLTLTLPQAKLTADNISQRDITVIQQIR